MTIDTIWGVWTPVLAAPLVGSFAGLVADRLPRGDGVVWGRSRCDGCGRDLGARDLVPVLSWVVLRGRARCCGAALTPAGPLIELGVTALTLWAALVLPPALVWPGLGLAAALVALAAIDLATFRLPDALTLPLIGGGLGLAALGLGGALGDHVLGAGLGYAAFAGLAVAYRYLRGRDGLGLGDAKLLAAAGAWVGWQGLGSVVLWGALGGLGLALATARTTGIGPATAVPFGPSLCLGFWITWVHGPLVLG